MSIERSSLHASPRSSRVITTLEIAAHRKRRRAVSARKTVFARLTCYTHAIAVALPRISRHSRTYGHAREHVNGTCHRWFFESHLSTKAARLFPFYSAAAVAAALAATYIYLHTFLSAIYTRCLSRTSANDSAENWYYLTRALRVRQTNRRCRPARVARNADRYSSRTCVLSCGLL